MRFDMEFIAPYNSSTVPSEYQHYIDILEKTNQQLGLWTNPYGLMVMVLTILVGFLAVGVTIAIFRQSKENREEMEKLRLEIRTKADQQLTEAKERDEQRQKEAEDRFDQLIAEKESILTKGASEGELKEVRKDIERLKEARATLPIRIGATRVQPLSDFGSLSQITGGYLGSPVHHCSQCGYGFIKDNLLSSLTGSLRLGGTPYACPKCGNVDEV